MAFEMISNLSRVENIAKEVDSLAHIPVVPVVQIISGVVYFLGH